MENKNLYQEYLATQMKDPEFAAHYALSKEKIHLEIALEKLKDKIELDIDKKIILRNLNQITKRIRQISL